MSGKPVSFRASESDRERLEAFAEDEGISGAEAARRAIDRGLAAHGYGASRPGGALESVARETAKACLWFAFAVAGAQLATAVDFSAVVLGFTAGAIACLAVEHAEPQLSEWISERWIPESDSGDGGSGEVAD
jgi:hypothetical protein